MRKGLSGNWWWWWWWGCRFGQIGGQGYLKKKSIKHFCPHRAHVSLDFAFIYIGLHAQAEHCGPRARPCGILRDCPATPLLIPPYHASSWIWSRPVSWLHL